MKKSALFLLVVVLAGCRGDGETDKVSDAMPPKPEKLLADTAPVQKPQIIPKIDPLSATYRGNLPCSPCQGMEVETILRLTDENRYFLTIRKINNAEERHFSGKYRLSNDKKFIQLDDSADTLTFLLGGDYLEPRLPDGSAGKRQFPDKNYQLRREPAFNPTAIAENV